jgi:hypothetical protein
VLSLALLGAAGSAVAAGNATVTVRGLFSDESGAALAGQTVRVLKSRTVLQVGGLQTRDQSVEETRVTTDAHGMFEIEFPVDRQFPYTYLRFYDPKTFDAVKYRLPEDREISRKARRGGTVQAPVVLKFHSDWKKVEALLGQYPHGSQCGQVLRSLGLPARREARDGGRELWVFDRAGMEYLIEGTRVLETRRIRPAEPAREESAEDPGETTPVPAVRVEDR